MSGVASRSFPLGGILSDQPNTRHHFIPASIISALVSAVLVLAGVFAVYTLIRDAKKDHMELVSALSKNNQEVVLLKIIDEKTKLPMETKVLAARTIINMTTVRRIPLDLACGIIDVETGGTWDPTLVSRAGALGWFQVMPATGKAYLRAERIDPTKQALIEPVNNAICGLQALADFHDQALDLELDKPGRWEVTLAMYNQGPKATKGSSYSQAVLEAAKRYKALGL